MYACTSHSRGKKNMASGQSHMPSGGCQGPSFCREGGPWGGQRASQTHGGLWPSVFLMALSQFIIDFNSAIWSYVRGENEAFTIRQRPEQQDVAGVQKQGLRGELFTWASVWLTCSFVFIRVWSVSIHLQILVLLCHRKHFFIIDLFLRRKSQRILIWPFVCQRDYWSGPKKQELFHIFFNFVRYDIWTVFRSPRLYTQTERSTIKLTLTLWFE